MLGIIAVRLDAQVVSEPPEPRITLPHFSFPEYQLTRQSQQAAEWARSLPIRDADGRIRYWIDLTDDAADAYQRTSPPDDGMPAYNKPEARHLIQAFVRQYNLRPYSMISWIGNGFSAYLDDVQVSALARDPRVTRITPDRWLRKSGSLWTESTGPNGQTLSWGTAVRFKFLATISGRSLGATTSKNQRKMGNHDSNRHQPKSTTTLSRISAFFFDGTIKPDSSDPGEQTHLEEVAYRPTMSSPCMYSIPGSESTPTYPAS
jgi:hypothetical protein